MTTAAGFACGGLTGIIAGGAIALITKKKCDQEVAEKQKEVEEVRAIYAEKAREDGDVKKEHKILHTEDKSANKEMNEYKGQIEKEGYTNYAGEKPGERVKPKKKPTDWIEPYVIAPDAFGELEEDEAGWSNRTLFYFEDNVLTDENYNEIKDREPITGDVDIGLCFGEYEDDSVYVRNENRKIDYEILLDLRKWSEVNRPKVKLMGDKK